MFSQAGQAHRSESKPGVRTIVVTRHCPREMYRSKWGIDQFVVAKQLGGGYASTVHLAVCKATGIQVAIKVYHRCKLSQLNNYQVQREIRIHSCLDHKHVLSLYAAFEDEVGIYLVTEYASRGDVFGDLDKRGGTMTEADAVRHVISPFLSALEYLHALNIIHRDIKPENLLLTAAGVLKVADFGLSIDITQERPVTRVGTLDYMAPEVVVCPDKCHPNDHKEKTHLHYTHLVDAWAVGVLAYELTVGRAPFDAGNKRGTIENILRSQPKFPAWISDCARHFVIFSLTKETSRRPGIQQLAEHPWIHQYGAVPRHNQINAGRAVSFHNLSMYTDPRKTAAAAQPRHKFIEQAASGQQEKFSNFQEEDEDEVYVSASGDAIGANAAEAAVVGISTCTAPITTAAAGQHQQAVSRPPVAQSNNLSRPPVPGAAVPLSQTTAGTPLAVPSHATSPPPAGVSPFAAAAAAPAASAPSSTLLRGLPVLGAAADKLRAFVHRCQSANDLESLRAFMMLQPPEPSNACFEPGGRFYTGPQQAAASNTSAAAAAELRPAVHDSAASLASSSSSSSSGRPVDTPRANSTGLPPLSMPRPLQLMKMSVASQQMPKSDSCKSLQGLAHIAEGKAEGKDSSTGGGAVPMSPNSQGSSLAGHGVGSPMPTSPAAATGQQQQQQSISEQQARSTGTQDHVGSVSISSCSCSSSCESGLHGSSASISSSHSWGYQQQQQQQGSEQYQAPQPPSPPCKVHRKFVNPFSSPDIAGDPHDPYAIRSHGQQQRQDSTTAAAVPMVAKTGPHRSPSCHDLDHLVTRCKSSSQGFPGSTVAPVAGRATLVNITADCRSSSQQQQQQQQLVSHSAGEMLLQGPLDQNHGCFAFLKSSRR